MVHSVSSVTDQPAPLWSAAAALLISVSSLVAMTWGTVFPQHEFSGTVNPLVWKKGVTFDLYPWIRYCGRNYRDIASHGYRRWPSASVWNVSYFPGYPWACWLMCRLTHVPLEWAMVLVANGSFILAASILPAYFRGMPWMTGLDQRRWLLLYFLWPVSLFFHSAHSESLFLLAVLGFLLSLKTRHSSGLWLAALFAGLAGCTRVVGAALSIVLAVHLYRRQSWSWSYAMKTMAILAVSCWGLVAASVYQFIYTGDPFAFLHARSIVALRHLAPWWERLASMLLLEPVWRPQWYFEQPRVMDVYGSVCWFCRFVWVNPIVVYIFPVLFVIASRHRLASFDELALAWLLWGIPYFAHGHENFLLSHARYNLFGFPAFSAVVFLTRHLPGWAFGILLVVLYVLLIFFSYGFGAECCIF